MLGVLVYAGILFQRQGTTVPQPDIGHNFPQQSNLQVEIDVVRPGEPPNDNVLSNGQFKPLETGDFLRVRVALKDPAFVYVVWSGGDGAIRPLATRAEESLPPEDEPRSFAFASFGVAIPSVDPNVPNTLLIFSRQEPLKDPNELVQAARRFGSSLNDPDLDAPLLVFRSIEGVYVPSFPGRKWDPKLAENPLVQFQHQGLLRLKDFADEAFVVTFLPAKKN
jgi:hypothetical protein